MHFFNRSHLSDDTLLRSLTTHVAEGRTNDAHVLADLAEVELRKLYAARGYSSMFAYCVGELGFCEQAAYKRLSAARAAQKHHAILGAVADGRLHRSAVVLLAPHLTSENAEELIRAATHRTKAQLEQNRESANYPRG